MRKTTRQLQHSKSARVQIGKGIPSPKEGASGDLTLRLTKTGVKLFAKFRDKWYLVGAGDLNQAAGEDQNTIIDTGNRKAINISTGKKGKIESPEDLTIRALNGKIIVDPDNGKLYFKDITNYIWINDAASTPAVQGLVFVNNSVPSVAFWQVPTLGTGVTQYVFEGGTITAADTTNTYDSVLNVKATLNDSSDSGSCVHKLIEGVMTNTNITGWDELYLLHLTGAGIFYVDNAGNAALPAGAKLYLDGGTHSYITESSADIVDIYAGGLNILKLDEANDKVEVLGANLEIDAAKKLYFDGGGDTYISENVADNMSLVVGGDFLLTLAEDGANGNEVLFKNSCASFTRVEATFSATAIVGSGGSDDTDIDFRHSNKYRLEMTADIQTMNLIFPKGSGNFTLVCATNGDHDVSNWKVYESDASAATTNDVMWAGGSVPAFTNNGIDIVSFYWDANEQQCYGVASLAFATP